MLKILFFIFFIFTAHSGGKDSGCKGVFQSKESSAFEEINNLTPDQVQKLSNKEILSLYVERKNKKSGFSEKTF